MKTLKIRCGETLEKYQPNPVLRENVKVQIGLSKTTKLSAVFNRYVEFCNEQAEGEAALISLKDLEFIHSQLLHGQDTAESSALMKGDEITAQADRSLQRQAEINYNKTQKEADKTYFNELHNLIFPSNPASRLSDVVLDCRGKITDESGRIQSVFRSSLTCHASIVARRCPWLGRLIAEAKASQEQNGGTNGEANNTANESILSGGSPTVARRESEEEDIVHLTTEVVPRIHTGATPIESDDFDLETSEDQEDDELPDPLPQKARVHVVLNDHAPQAVRILLTFLYCNRVPELGYEAFVQSSKGFLKKVKESYPVSPFGNLRRWPAQGKPTISFKTALAALSLAEESSMARLSLMCEIAASQLVTTLNVTDALTKCEMQKRATGNELGFLRRAAMAIVLGSTSTGVELFEKSILSQSCSLVSTLIAGTAEAIEKAETSTKKKSGFSLIGSKRDRRGLPRARFDDLDYEDRYARAEERLVGTPQRGPLLEEEAHRRFPRRKETRSEMRRSYIQQRRTHRPMNRVAAAMSARRGSRRVQR